MSGPFVAPTPWSSDRPKTLVVCCSDGRWHAQMMEFVHHEVGRRPDLYAVPGGPAVLDAWNSSFDESRAFWEGMRLLTQYHDISGVWLIAHEGCAFYARKHPHLEAGAVRERQVQDLVRAREALLEHKVLLNVRLIYAAHREDDVVFEPCQLDSLEKRP